MEDKLDRIINMLVRITTLLESKYVISPNPSKIIRDHVSDSDLDILLPSSMTYFFEIIKQRNTSWQ